MMGQVADKGTGAADAADALATAAAALAKAAIDWARAVAAWRTQPRDAPMGEIIKACKEQAAATRRLYEIARLLEPSLSPYDAARDAAARDAADCQSGI